MHETLKTFANLKSLVQDDFIAVETLFQNTVNSKVSLIHDMYNYIMSSGGKRLRPLLVLLLAKAFGYQGPHHVKTAAAIELIHTVTLLHDDVIDEASLRRGRQSANTVWGNSAAILVGDYLFSRAFEMIIEGQNLKMLSMMSRITSAMTEGEVMQMVDRHNPDTSEETYFEIIRRKTGRLFEGATKSAAILAGATEALEDCAGQFGLHLGSAFQLIDDILDFEGDPAISGKHLGNDLMEGKVTLPLIYAMKHGTKAERDLIRTAILDNVGMKGQKVLKAEYLTTIVNIIENTGAIQYTRGLAQIEGAKARTALSILPATPYRDAALETLDLAIHRSF